MLRDILTQSASRIVVAMGCMFVIVSGSADLSGGRTVGLAAVISGSLAQQATYYLKFWPSLPELPVIVPVLVSIAVGLLVGCFNGFVVSRLKVPAFLATLGTQMIVYGANCLYFNKAPNNSQPLGGYLENFGKIGTGAIFGIPYLGHHRLCRDDAGLDPADQDLPGQRDLRRGRQPGGGPGLGHQRVQDPDDHLRRRRACYGLAGHAGGRPHGQRLFHLRPQL